MKEKITKVVKAFVKNDFESNQLFNSIWIDDLDIIELIVYIEDMLNIIITITYIPDNFTIEDFINHVNNNYKTK